MQDELFDTKVKIEAAISDFTNMMMQPGWILLEKVIDANIEVVTKHILAKTNLEGEKATEGEMDRLRDKLKVYEEVKNTPKRLIKQYTETGEIEEPNPDPYPRREEPEEEEIKSA